MQEAVIHFTVSALLSAVTIAALIPLSRRFGWLDRPDARKQHRRPTPPIGGFGLFLGVVLPLLWLQGMNPLNLGFIVGGGLLLAVGALDDRFDLDWKLRIAAETAAALAMIYISGVRAEHVGPLFGFGDIELGLLSIPFTVFVTLGLINALNMFDGIDGLAGSVSAAAAVMLICAALYSGSYGVAFGLTGVLGALFGFLWFNLRLPWQPHARVFLGDAGSGFLGFTLAFVIFRLTQNPGHPVSPVLGPFLLAPPIIDCLVLIVHRLRRGRSPFAAGRDHGHHLLLDAGYSVSEIVRYMVLLTCCTGLFGAVCMILDVPASLMVMMYLLALFIWFWITASHERAMRVFRRVHRVLFGRSAPRHGRSDRTEARP